MKTLALLFLISLASLTAAPVSASDLPRGKWWRRQEIVQRLSLVDEQQTKLDAIFRTSANDLIDLRSNVDKQSVALRAELDRAQLDRQAIQRLAAKISEARARLFDRELTMLVDMRSVLTETQWTTLRGQLEAMSHRKPAADR